MSEGIYVWSSIYIRIYQGAVSYNRPSYMFTLCLASHTVVHNFVAMCNIEGKDPLR